jgi:hypothetical protein
MTPAEAEAEFITLWQQGLETAAIAAQLGIKATTAQSRAHLLQQRGLIQPRPRGGNHPTQPRRAALAGVSCRTPLPPDRVASVRWNLHLSARLRERIKAMAAVRGLQDSQMVEELLWLALSVAEEAPRDE